MAIDDDAAANEIAHEKIGVGMKLVAPAKQQFSRAGRCCVVAEMHRPVAQLGNLADEVEITPGFQHLMGSAYCFFPIPQLKGSRNAKSANSFALAGDRSDRSSCSPTATKSTSFCGVGK